MDGMMQVTGQAVAKRLEPLNLLWLEEPIPAENVEAYKLITNQLAHRLLPEKIIISLMGSEECWK